jgi:UDP-N-acetylmuramoyl-tripeptide--D-alanyl-D-alanine ligase
MKIPELYKLFLNYPSVETDTRKLKKGDIFFALKGPNFNGNAYAQKALEAGASYCVCDEAIDNANDRIILVQDSLDCLQQLSKYHRQQFDIPIIAITGSNGKTTTKELISKVLSSTYKTYTTEGNLNNHIGVPLTLLRIKKDAEIAVIEMGANHQKEIEHYCAYTLPTHGIITNCGKAHLEGFGGEEGIKKGKGELLDFIRKTNGTVFINSDYDYLMEMSEGIDNQILYGEKNGELTGKIINDDSFLEVGITKGADIPSIKTQLVGGYNLPNILTAVCVGKTFKVSNEDIKTALENYQPTNSRSQLIQKGSNKIILDAYNANPSSMKVAIENFAHMAGQHKILILGAMMELGESSLKEHAGIISLINKFPWQQVVLVGKDYVDLPENFKLFNNSLEAREWYLLQEFENTQILIKGSRSMQMEKLLE